MGFFKLKAQTAGPEQRKEIIKRGIFGIVGVILVAYAVSFLGGGSNDEAAQQSAKSQNNSSDTIALDTKSLLEDDAQGSQPAAAPIPAKQKFDYQGQANSATADVGPQMAADAPITTPAPLTSQDDPDAVPALDDDPFASSSNNTQPQLAPQTVAPQPAPQPQVTQPQAAPQVQQTPVQDTSAAVTPKPQAPAATKAVLYCGTFSSQSKAEEQKALMAFQGLQSTVVKHNGNFTLKLGPYKSRDAARQAFSKVDATGLVSECSLENE